MDASPAAASHQVKGQMRHAPVTQRRSITVSAKITSCGAN